MHFAFGISALFITMTVTLLLLLYKCSTMNFKHWEERGVPYIKPLPLVGNFWNVLTGRLSIGHYLAEFYNQFDAPYFGIFIFNKPRLIIKSPDLIKFILVKEFQSFPDHTVYSDEKLEPMTSKFLFFSKHADWRPLRTKISPVFSTGKLKDMTILMNSVANEFKKYLENNSHRNFIEAKEVCAKFSIDLIATCAFGIDANSFKSEDAEFRAMGRLAFGRDWKSQIAQTYPFLSPELVKLLKIPFFEPKLIDFIRRVFWETLTERKRSQTKRHDLIDSIAQMGETIEVEGKLKFEVDNVAAQAGQFFIAGFETISSTMAFTMYELSLQPNIQNQAREEIESVLSTYGELSYDAIREMQYLDMIVNESLRKYPTLPFIDRICVKDCKVPDSNFVIEKGTPIYIPMFGLHYDPKYFPDPENFDPERFSGENRNSFPEYAFIPFGKGPRSCIGARFGLLATKLGLAHILSEFVVEKTEETRSPLVFETKGFVITSKYGLPLRFKKIR